MSLITEVRTKADSAVRTRIETASGTTRATLHLAQNVLSTAGGDARERVSGVTEAIAGRATARATARVEDVRNVASSLTTAATTAVGMARKQALVTLGAGDFVLETLTKRAEEIPSEVQRNAGKSVATATGVARTARAQAALAATEVRTRGGKVVGTARKAELPDVPDVRGVIDSRVGQALRTFDQLAARGEKVVVAVRHSPRLLDVVRDVDHATENVANEVSSVAGKVRYRAAANARSVRSLKGAGTRAAAQQSVPASALVGSGRTAAVKSGSAPKVTPVKPALVKRTAPVKQTAKSAAAKPAPVTRADRSTAAASKTSPRKASAVKSSAVKSSAVKSSAVKSSAVKSSAVKSSAVKSSAAKSATKSSTSKAPATRTNGRKAAPRRATASATAAK